MPINNRPQQDEGTLQSILKGKAIVNQRLAGQANPDFWKKDLTDKDYLRISAEGTKDIAPSRTLAGTAKDVAVTAAKGVVGLGEAAVGLADIPTLGRAGKAMEDYLGYDAGATQAFLGEFYSEPQKAAFSEVEKAKGFWDTTKTMIQHPSTIAHMAVESMPSMLGSAAMAKKILATGVLKASPVWNRILASAIGEGTVAMGAGAEQVRGQTKDGFLTAKQAATQVASGFGTGVFGVVGGRVAKKIGVDPDVFLAGGSDVTTKGVIKRIIGSGISEAAFEELPQSMQEQVWLNAAMDKPLMDGVAEAGAAGMLTGGFVGGVFGGLAKPTPKKEDTAKEAILDEGEETAKDILTKEPEVVPGIVPEETLAAEEAAAGITEEALEAAEPAEPVEEVAPKPKWVDDLGDDQLVERAGNLRKVKEEDLSDKQKSNLAMLQEEMADRGIVEKETEDAEGVRRKAKEAGERKELERKEKERIRIWDAEKNRLAAEKKKADEAEKIKIEKAKKEKPAKLAEMPRQQWEDLTKKEFEQLPLSDRNILAKKFPLLPKVIRGERAVSAKKAEEHDRRIKEEIAGVEAKQPMAELKKMAEEGKQVAEKFKDLPFVELSKRSNALQEKIDIKHNELDAQGVSEKNQDKDPALSKLYKERIAYDTAASIKGYEGAKQIVQNELGDIPYKSLYVSVDSILSEIYSLSDSTIGGVYAMSKYTGEALSDNAGTIKKLGKDISKLLFNKDFPQSDFFATMESSISGLTQKGKERYIKEGLSKAKGIHGKIKQFFLEKPLKPELAELPATETAEKAIEAEGIPKSAPKAAEPVESPEKEKIDFGEYPIYLTADSVQEMVGFKSLAKQQILDWGEWRSNILKKDLKAAREKEVFAAGRPAWDIKAAKKRKSEEVKKLLSQRKALEKFIKFRKKFVHAKLPGAETVTEPAAAPEAVPEFEGVDISKIIVEVEAIREATGETIKVREAADAAMESIDKDIETYYFLLNCITT